MVLNKKKYNKYLIFTTQVCKIVLSELPICTIYGRAFSIKTKCLFERFIEQVDIVFTDSSIDIRLTAYLT